jgi:predicted porin
VTKDGNGNGIRVGFANGPFNVALALSKTEYAAGDVKQNNIGGEWNFGLAKLQGHYARDENGSVKAKGWLLGGLVPVGAGEIRLAYSRYRVELAGDPTSKKIALGYVHNLSKRTALYVTAARVTNSGGAAASVVPGAATGPAANEKSTGYDFGLRHSF